MKTHLQDEFYTRVPWLDLRGNDSLLPATTMEELFAKAQEQESNLAVDSEWIRYNPQLRHIGGRKMALEIALGRWQADERKKIIAEVGGISDTVAGRLSDTDLRELAERQQLISEILSGHKGFVVLDSQGKKTSYDERGHNIQFSAAGGRAQAKDAGFDGMNISELRELHDVVVGQRAMREMSPDQLKSIINTDRVQKLHATSASEKEVNAPLTDNAGNVVYAVPAPAVAAVIELRNPDTDELFTRRTLITFLNQKKENARRLLTYSDGRSRPGAAAALEAILRSSN